MECYIVKTLDKLLHRNIVIMKDGLLLKRYTFIGDIMNLKKFRKNTEYNHEKNNKKNNFTYLNNNYCKTGQTVLLGDSITELFNDNELFKEYREKSGLAVYNRGISGDTTDRLIERLEDNVINIQPRNIVLLIGTNDFGHCADVEYVYSNIELIVDKLLTECNGVNIVLEAILPVGKHTQTKKGRNNTKYVEINAMLKNLAQQKGIKFFDITDKLIDKDGFFDTRYTYDGLHPNVQGFEITAKEILKYI